MGGYYCEVFLMRNLGKQGGVGSVFLTASQQ